MFSTQINFGYKFNSNTEFSPGIRNVTDDNRLLNNDLHKGDREKVDKFLDLPSNRGTIKRMKTEIQAKADGN